MKLFLTLGFSVLLVGSLAAQSVVDTVGGTSSAPNRAAMAKANLFKVDKTVMLLKQEWYLKIPGAETLTFFRYRYHSQHGAYKLDWSKTVKVTGTGAGWYSPGITPIPLIEGNHYMLGVSWVGTVTYHYIRGTSGQKVSFGSWYRGVTPTGMPQTYNISSVDIAQYNQRLTTAPLVGLKTVGAPCTSSSISPRLVTATLPMRGSNFTLDLVNGPPANAVLFLMNPNPNLSPAIPFYGCSFWVNPFIGPLFLFPQTTSASGVANLTLPIPGDPMLSGVMLTWQGLTVSPSISLSNAIVTRL